MHETPAIQLSPDPTLGEEMHDVLGPQAARVLGLCSAQDLPDTTPREELPSVFTTTPSPSTATPSINLPIEPPLTTSKTGLVAEAIELSELRQRQVALDSGQGLGLATSTPVLPALNGAPLSASAANYNNIEMYNKSAFAGLSWKAKAQFMSMCFLFFQSGWNDGSTGPLLPRIQAVYGIGFTIVSLIFIVACAGYLTAVVTNLWLTDKLGFGKVAVIGAASQGLGYIVQASAPPFPLFAASYFFNGFGGALLQAQVGGFVTAMPNAPPKLAVLLAAWGAGALASPLAATQFAVLSRWSFLFLCSLGIAVSDVICLCLALRLKNQAELFEEMRLPPGETDPSFGADNKFWQIMRMKSVHLFSFFSLVYVGVEVTIGGWIVTFIRDTRDGGASSGYISSGFFGGLTAGRLSHLWLTSKIGERNAILLYGFLAIGFEIVVWFLPSLIGSALAVSIVGVLFGPMFPIMMNQSGKVFPRWLLTPCLGWVSGFGQTGSAVLPFATGALAGKFGIGALQPFLIAMMSLMMFLWFLSPKPQRRED